MSHPGRRMFMKGCRRLTALWALLVPLVAHAQDIRPNGSWSGSHGTDADRAAWFTIRLDLDERAGHLNGAAEFKQNPPAPPPGTPPGGVYGYIPWRVTMNLDGRYGVDTEGGFTKRKVELVGKGEVVDAGARWPVTVIYKLELGANDCCLEGTAVADRDYGPFKAGRPVAIHITRVRH